MIHFKASHGLIGSSITALLALYGTRETPSNRYYLVTLGGQCLLDGLELVVPLKNNKKIVLMLQKIDYMGFCAHPTRGGEEKL
jgi:hypothetical protein